MSKKSRKRNKKILGALAAGLGAMALMKRKKASVANTAASEGANVGINTRPSLIDAQDAGTNFIKKAPVDTAVVADTSDSRFPTRFSKPKEELISKALRSQILQAKANAPKGINFPGSVPMQRTGLGPRRFKHGGSVTGIAKRGFGRALMKGKK